MLLSTKYRYDHKTIAEKSKLREEIVLLQGMLAETQGNGQLLGSACSRIYVVIIAYKQSSTP